MGASKEEWEWAVTGDPGHFLGRDTGLVCHACPPHRLTRAIIKTLDRLARRALPLEDTPEHQQTGRRGEEDVYFHLRKNGYAIVARNFRSPRRKGGIEVKTRTSRDIKASEAAVHKARRQELVAVTREYLRRMHLRASGVAMWSVYIMTKIPPGLRLSCSKMPSPYRTIKNWVSLTERI